MASCFCVGIMMPYIWEILRSVYLDNYINTKVPPQLGTVQTEESIGRN